MRWNRGAVSHVALPDQIGNTRIKVLYTDRSGRLWAALADGRVVIRDTAGVFKIYDLSDGLGAGTCRQIFEDDEGAIWLAAIGGLSKYSDGRFQTVRSDHGFPVSDLTAITEDDVHTLWIGTGLRTAPNIEARFRRGRRWPFGRCGLHARTIDRTGSPGFRTLTTTIAASSAPAMAGSGLSRREG